MDPSKLAAVLTKIIADRRAPLVAALTLTAIFLAATLPLTGIGAVDSRYVSVFSSDEEFIAQGIHRMLTRPSLSYGFWFYPGFYMNLSVILTGLIAGLGVPLHAATLIGPRLVSTLALVATAVFAGLLARRLAGRRGAAVAAALLTVTTSELLAYGLIAHPDTVQTALLTAGLWLLSRYLDRGRACELYAVAAVAGLAFVTKFAGAFLVPVIFLAALWTRWRPTFPEQGGSALRHALFHDGPRLAGAFLAATLVGAPTFWFSIRAFAMTVARHNEISAYGFFVRETQSGATWFPVMAHEGLIGPVVAAAALAALAVVIVRTAQAWPRRVAIAPSSSGGDPTALAAAVLTTAYVVLYVGFLVARTRMFEYRYLFPIVPILYALVAGVLTRLCGGLATRWIRRACAVALVIGVAAVLPARLDAAHQLFQTRLQQANHPCQEAGRWLREHVPTQTAIAYDHYAYVPIDFPNVRDSWGMTPELVSRAGTGVVITTDVIRARYRRTVDASGWRQGEERFAQSCALYEALERGALPEYRLVAEFAACNGTRIYRRDADSGADAESGARHE